VYFDNMALCFVFLAILHTGVISQPAQDVNTTLLWALLRCQNGKITLQQRRFNVVCRLGDVAL